jgi:hypothetical protein
MLLRVLPQHAMCAHQPVVIFNHFALFAALDKSKLGHFADDIDRKSRSQVVSGKGVPAG